MLRRVVLLAAILAVMAWIGGSGKLPGPVAPVVHAQTSSIQVQASTINGWTATAPGSSPELRIYINQDTVFADGTSQLAGNPGGDGQGNYIAVTCSVSGTTLTIPGFNLEPTTNATPTTSAYTAWIFSGSGVSGNQIQAFSLLSNSAVPYFIASTSGCSPGGTCATLADLIQYNRGPNPANVDFSTYSRSEIDQKIAANIQSQVPVTAPFWSGGAVAGMANLKRLDLLGTGLVKNTAGTPSIAVSGTDYLASIIGTPPITISGGNTISVTSSNLALGANLSFTAGSGTAVLLGSGGATISLGANVPIKGSSNTWGNALQVFQAGSNFDLVDPTDTSKILQFNVAGVTSANTRTVNVPDATSSFAQAQNSVSHQWLKSFSATTGAFTTTQPAAADLSDGTTGSGNVVLANTPTLITPALGVATATSINGLTLTSSTGTLTVANGKTGTFTNSIALAGTDGSILSLAGNLTTSGAFGVTFTFTNTTSVTFPTSGTLVNSAVTTLSSLTSVGTIGTGVWQGTAVGAGFGGTGANSSAWSGVPSINAGAWQQNAITTNGLAYGAALNSISFTSAGANAVFLTNGSSVPVLGAVSANLSIASSTLDTIQPIQTTSTVTFGSSSAGSSSAGSAAGLSHNWGQTVNSQATGTVGATEIDALYNPTTNASAEYPTLFIKPTFNASGSSAGRTIDWIKLDSTDTGLTGLSNGSLFFMNARRNGAGSAAWTVDVAGNETLAGNLSAVNGAFSGPVTGSTINGLTVTTSTGTLTITNGKTISFSNTMTLAAGADGQTFTFPSSTDTMVGRASTDTLTNKTLTSTTNVLGTVTMTLGSDATGDVYYRDAGGHLARLGIGGAGTFIGNSGGVPVWATPTGSGTVNSGTSGNLAYYASSTTAVSTVPGTTVNATNQTLAIAGAAASSAWTPLLSLTPGALTSVTQEVNSVLHAAQTITVHTGFANQRFAWIRQPVITADAAGLTVTSAATLTIEGAPATSAGGGFTPTLTNDWALWIPSGKNLAGVDWLTGFRIATTLSTQLNGISPTSQLGVTGASRQSDSGPSGSVIGVSGWAWYDIVGTSAGSGAWGGYFESHMGNNSNISPGNSANAIGVEIDSVNQVSPFNNSRATSYSIIPNQMSTALWLASGGGGGQAPTTYTNSVRSHLAIGIINNTQTFDKGIVFSNKALARVGDLAGGTGTGLATAIEMATGMQLSWMNPSSVQIAYLSDQGMLLPYATQILMTNQAGSLNIPAIQLATVNSQNNVLLLGAAASVTTTTNPISNMWVGSTSILNSLNTTTFFGFQASDGIGGSVVSAAVGASPSFRTVRSDGTSGGLTTTQNGDVIGSFQNAAYDGTAFKVSALIQTLATENYVNGSNTGSQMKFFITQTGTNSTFLAMNITGTGAVVLTGTNTNDSAAAGQVGEFVNSLVATGSAVSLTTNTAANVTSISLTAGDWDVQGSVDFNLGAATTLATTPGQVGISTTTATLPSDGSEVMVQETALTTTTTKVGMSLPRKRISVNTTTTVFLVGLYQFSAGTTTAYGTISARRVR